MAEILYTELFGIEFGEEAPTTLSIDVSDVMTITDVWPTIAALSIDISDKLIISEILTQLLPAFKVSIIDKLTVSELATLLAVIMKYSRGDYGTLPLDDADLENLFTQSEYNNVELDDDNYAIQSATNEYSVTLFKDKHTNDTDPIRVVWKGKSSLAPYTNTIRLQIYDRVTGGGQWVNVDSNSAAVADEEFTLEGTITTNLSNYYDASYWVSFRVYQEV